MITLCVRSGGKKVHLPMMDVEHKYYNLFIALCIDIVWKKIYEISRERCNCCEIDNLSQSEHSCLMDSSYMKLVMNFELAFMNLYIREVFHIMLRDHDCDRAEIITLSEIMKTHCLTDF